ncbi:YaiI/YqxD family protein [Oscillochloris sp. ZM17-4]|uniref:YaiI/YqxD family protein n=1 Tax=Oscillochloris sp. ZM17-4 TaxID=2866714 RepID=UPI001C72B81B|nr:YaiI/YqxD family protein [Oscillochloris sp. ZM17-4]MBX0327396.1 YaiI/YqxD family protein [Oscillochloris sp. ZM17-4]
MKIWVDADACPRAVKELVFRASARLSLPVCLVANRRLALPDSPLITLTQVPQGSDVADGYIVQHVAPGDLVITADIPLAALVVARGAVALDPRGEIHTAETVGERLAVRDLMEELRWAGLETGGPAAYGAADRQRFAQSLDRLLPRAPRR